MTLNLPAWYQGGFEDQEALVCDLFEWLLGDEIPVVTWLPDDAYDDPRPMLRVHRTSGRSEAGLPYDHAVVSIGAWSRTRKESWELITFVRHVMAACSGGFKVPRSFEKNGERAHTQIMSVEEWAGPIQVADEFIDDRYVSVAYRVLVREPRSTPNYRQIMSNLPS